MDTLSIVTESNCVCQISSNSLIFGVNLVISTINSSISGADLRELDLLHGILETGSSNLCVRFEKEDLSSL